MAKIKPFRGFRPPRELAAKIASRPYDVLNSGEAREEAADNPYSLLHIIKSEIDLEPGIDVHSEAVYNKARENFHAFIEQGWLVQDDEEYLYVYAQTWQGKTQYGLVAGASVDDYNDGIIKKHELTRPEKEEDRMKHILVNNANIEPVFFTYKKEPAIDDIIARYIDTHDPEYDFTADDGVGHRFWVIRKREVIDDLVEQFAAVPATYVADGHHRTAAAARVGMEKRKNNPNHTGEEAYNYFLAVHFPHDQLTIIDYNRVIRDLNGHTPDEILKQLEKSFMIEHKGTSPFRPDKLHCFSMYLDGYWYALTALPGTYSDDDPIGILDVTVLTEQVLKPLFNITDLRRSDRIDFVGGIRGLEELKRRVDSGEMQVAFALYPVSLEQLITIADTGNIMPPKTTWFEPKLRSGLVIHSLKD
ncbi:MAG: DUF1015 domain-containing protein [Chlorobi bacterium]|nr:DUF1015 domain-containing protein [Chlorobiota bacterium]